MDQKYKRRDTSPFDCGVVNITVRLLPGCSLTCIKQLILGIPWLKQENPRIDWRQGQVSIIKNGETVFLPCHRQESTDDAEVQCLRAMCSAKAFQQEMKFQSPAFVGILRAVKSEDKDGQSEENTMTEVEKIKREDLPEDIWKICEEFKAVFP